MGWYNRSQKEKTRKFTMFDQFISLWLSFNAWGTYKSREDQDYQMLRWIKTNTGLPEIHNRLMNDDAEYQQRVRRLSEYTVLDMRPGHQDESKSIENTNSFDELLDIIYQIRCNLFHGQKSEIDPNDRELVDLAFHILSKIFRPVINEMK
ncbi:MAG: hypothetical protein PVH73_01025 [Candidatus Bathyarchaeota archaeon]